MFVCPSAWLEDETQRPLLAEGKLFFTSCALNNLCNTRAPPRTPPRPPPPTPSVPASSRRSASSSGARRNAGRQHARLDGPVINSELVRVPPLLPACLICNLDQQTSIRRQQRRWWRHRGHPKSRGRMPAYRFSIDIERRLTLARRHRQPVPAISQHSDVAAAAEHMCLGNE